MCRSFLLFFILTGLVVFSSCSSDKKADDQSQDNKAEKLENFEGIIELMVEGTYMACGSTVKIPIIDKSENALSEYKSLGIPRMQPGYGSFKGYKKVDKNGADFIELLQLYSIKTSIPKDCIEGDMPYGILSTLKDKYRLQINPYDNLIRYQDKIINDILDFPYYPFKVEGDYDVFTSSIKTVDSEFNIKIFVKQEECKKPYIEDASFNTSVKVEIDGRSYSGCATKTL